MDTVTDSDFYKTYIRVDSVAVLQGANTAAEIEKIIQRKLDEYPSRLSPGWRNFLRRIKRSFSRRCIDEAVTNPHGFVGLSLKYGSSRAKKIFEQQAWERLEVLRKRAEKRKKNRKKTKKWRKKQ